MTTSEAKFKVMMIFLTAPYSGESTLTYEQTVKNIQQLSEWINSYDLDVSTPEKEARFNASLEFLRTTLEGAVVDSAQDVIKISRETFRAVDDVLANDPTVALPPPYLTEEVATGTGDFMADGSVPMTGPFSMLNGTTPVAKIDANGYGFFGEGAASWAGDGQTLISFGRNDGDFSLISGWNINDSFWMGVNPNDAGQFGTNQAAIVIGTYNANSFDHPPLRVSIGVGADNAIFTQNDIRLNRNVWVKEGLYVGADPNSPINGADIVLNATGWAGGGMIFKTDGAGVWLSRFVAPQGPDFIRFGHDIDNYDDVTAVIKSDGSIQIGQSPISYGFIGEYVAVSSTSAETAFLARSEGSDMTVEMMMTAFGGPGSSPKGGYIGTSTDSPVFIFSNNANIAKFSMGGVHITMNSGSLGHTLADNPIFAWYMPDNDDTAWAFDGNGHFYLKYGDINLGVGPVKRNIGGGDVIESDHLNANTDLKVGDGGPSAYGTAQILISYADAADRWLSIKNATIESYLYVETGTNAVTLGTATDSHLNFQVFGQRVGMSVRSPDGTALLGAPENYEVAGDAWGHDPDKPAAIVYGAEAQTGNILEIKKRTIAESLLAVNASGHLILGPGPAPSVWTPPAGPRQIISANGPTANLQMVSNDTGEAAVVEGTLSTWAGAGNKGFFIGADTQHNVYMYAGTFNNFVLRPTGEFMFAKDVTPGGSLRAATNTVLTIVHDSNDALDAFKVIDENGTDALVMSPGSLRLNNLGGGAIIYSSDFWAKGGSVILQQDPNDDAHQVRLAAQALSGFQQLWLPLVIGEPGQQLAVASKPDANTNFLEWVTPAGGSTAIKYAEVQIDAGGTIDLAATASRVLFYGGGAQTTNIKLPATTYDGLFYIFDNSTQFQVEVKLPNDNVQFTVVPGALFMAMWSDEFGGFWDAITFRDQALNNVQPKWIQEIVTLNATDIANQYFNCSTTFGSIGGGGYFPGFKANSFTIRKKKSAATAFTHGDEGVQGFEFTLLTVGGGPNGFARVVFAGDWATGGPAALADGDVLVVRYAIY